MSFLLSIRDLHFHTQIKKKQIPSKKCIFYESKGRHPGMYLKCEIILLCKRKQQIFRLELLSLLHYTNKLLILYK